MPIQVKSHPRGVRNKICGGNFDDLTNLILQSKPILYRVCFSFSDSFTIIMTGYRNIAWWMLDLWFGLDASGFEKASESG